MIATDPDDIHAYNVADFESLSKIVDDLTSNLCNSVKGPGKLSQVLLCLGGDLTLKHSAALEAFASWLPGASPELWCVDMTYNLGYLHLAHSGQSKAFRKLIMKFCPC